MRSKVFASIVVLTMLTLVFCNDGGENVNHSQAATGESGDTVDSISRDSVILVDDFLAVEISYTDEKTPEHVSTRVDVVIHSMKGYDQDTTFAKATADTLEAILNSPGFKRAVRNTVFQHNRGLTSEQIYDTIMAAREVRGPQGSPNVIDLRLRTITPEEDEQIWIRRCGRSTVGKEADGSGIAAVCSDWLRSTAEQKKHGWLAAHFIHEYMHMLNFSHPSNKYQSVPYRIEKIVEYLYDQPSRRL